MRSSAKIYYFTNYMLDDFCCCCNKFFMNLISENSIPAGIVKVFLLGVFIILCANNICSSSYSANGISYQIKI